MWKNLFKSSIKFAAVATREVIKEVPAEVIHADVDAQEEIFLNQIKAIIAEKENSTVEIDKRMKSKSELMKSLGFSSNNNVINKEVVTKTTLNEQLAKDKAGLEESIDLFQEYKNKYPMEKIIPFEMFNKVLNKYNLIYSPAQAYIQDVPEKNLLEIKKAKETSAEDFIPDLHILSDVALNYRMWDDISNKPTEQQIANFINNNKDVKFVDMRKKYEDKVEFIGINKNKDHISTYTIQRKLEEIGTSWGNMDHELFRIYIDFNPNNFDDLAIEYQEYSFKPKYMLYPITRASSMGISSGFKQILKELDVEYFTFVSQKVENGLEIDTKSQQNIKDKLRREFRCSDVRFETKAVKRNCLFIAAPKSHFDLQSLETVDGLAYYYKTNVNVSIKVETKDPIAFHILAGNEQYPEGFVRILSKWGTEDDQSYLDPIVQDERLN